jgi:hypothetical protein
VLLTLIAIAWASAPAASRQIAPIPQLLRLVVRSFLPREHIRNPNYVRPVPSMPGLFIVPSPESGCFATDGRGFSTSLDVVSRATTEFVMVIDGPSVSLATAADRNMFRVEPLRTVDCQTGAAVGAPRTPPAAPMTIDTLASYEGTAQVVFSASVSNPFMLAPAPDRMREDAALRYGGSLIFDTKARTLGFKGFISVFPAFEAFAEDERGLHPLFRIAPQAQTTIETLYDPHQTTTTRPVEVTISLK